MTRHVFPSEQVAHLWAHQSQEHARNSSRNVSFDGSLLFSYATPIGRIVEDRNGEPCALFTVHSYSMTTSGKHLHPMYSAARHLPHWRVPYFGIGSRGRHHEPGNPYGQQKPLAWHSANLAYLCEQYRASVARLSRMLSEPYDLATIGERLREDIATGPAAYALRFPCDAKSRAMLRKLDAAADARAIQERFAKLAARRADPKYSAKMTAAREAREALRIKREQRARELASATAAEKVAAWRAGELAALPYGCRDYDAGALLRIRGRDVETSQGARVPIADARRACAFIIGKYNAGKTWARNGERFPVGAFELDSIGEGGTVRAGCHKFEAGEVKALAALLAVQS